MRAINFKLLDSDDLRRYIVADLKRRELTQKHLSEACGISESYMSDILNSKRCIPGIVAAAFGFEEIRGYIKSDDSRITATEARLRKESK